MKPKYKVTDKGDVVWSDIILIKAIGKTWSPFAPAGGYPGESRWHTPDGLKDWHTPNGLKEWMEDNGWDAKILIRDTENFYKYGMEEFWIPLDLPRRDLVCRWFNGKWIVFKGEGLSFRNFNEWIDWAKKHGWSPKALTPQRDGDKRVWIHGYGNHEDRIFIPEIDEEPDEEQGNTIPAFHLVTCVNPLGCALTLGKIYAVQDQEDDMLLIIDDEGVKQAFLPERFAPDLSKLALKKIF